MKTLQILPAVLIIMFLTNTIYAENYAEKECVRSYNTMVKYSNKARLNAKAHSRHSMNINFKMAKSYAAEAIVDCNNVRNDLHYKAQNSFDELIAIDENIKQIQEEARIEADAQKEIEEAEEEARAVEAELKKEIAEAEEEAKEEMN